MGKFIYNGIAAEEKDASGVKGMILRTASGPIFRVYKKDGEFDDYDIMHDDLAVTIDSDAFASFYKSTYNKVLDHSPDVLALEEVNDK